MIGSDIYTIFLCCNGHCVRFGNYKVMNLAFFVTESHDRLHINSLSVMLRVFHSVQDIVGRLLARDLQEKNLNRPLHDTGCLLSLHT